MLCVLFLSLFAGATANSDASDASANPVRKIVTLMQDMQKELEAEHEKEQELYDKFMCFCSTGEEDLKKTSADAAANIDSLSASLEEMKAEKSGLEEDLVKHKSELSQAEQDLAKAEALRGKENEAYEEDHANSVQATTALSKAIPALEMSMSAASLVQLRSGGIVAGVKAALQKSETVSSEEKKQVLAFMDSTDVQSSKTPAGQQIVGILKAMSDEMLKNDATATASEADSVKGFGELKAAKEGEIEYAKENIEKKNARVGTLAVEIVQATDGVEDSTAEKANADKFLANLGEQCAAKSKEWSERTKMHTDEVAAISEAIDILNADDALDVFKKTAASFTQKPANGPHQYGFLQAGQKTGLMQLQKAERTIAAASTFYKSQKLSMLLNSMRGALRSASHHKVGQAVDFTEILKMVDNMIEVLGKEQKDDEKHKDWCVSEHQKSEDDAATAKSTIESLDAEMANLADEISTLTDDIAALAEGIKTLDKDVAVATEMRKSEHAEYLETAQLTEAGIALLGKAKNRMQKFYNPTLYKAEPTEAPAAFFAQIHAVTHSLKGKVAPPEAPATFGKYEKNKKSGGVLQLMDNLTNELKASLAEAEHSEKTAQTDYQELMTDSQETRSQDDASLTDKSAAKANLEGKLMSAKETKHMTLKELDNIGAYIAQLHGSCDFILDNFKLRAEARSNELEALKNAKAILSGANFA